MFYLSIPHLGQKTCFYGNGCTMVHEQRAAVRCDAVRCRELRETTRKKGKRLVVRGFLFGGGGLPPFFGFVCITRRHTGHGYSSITHLESLFLFFSFCFVHSALFLVPCFVLFCFFVFAVPWEKFAFACRYVPPPFFCPWGGGICSMGHACNR